MQRFRRICPVLLAVAFPSALLAEQMRAGIEIISASFGKTNANGRQDVAGKLAAICQSATERCDVFCSPADLGVSDPGRRSVCRTTWRCPDGTVRSTEAAVHDVLPMRCPVVSDRETDVNELPAAPTYTPPQN